MQKFLFLAFFTLTGMQLFAQGRTITGRVTDADNGEYLAGVTVLLEGTMNGPFLMLMGNTPLTCLTRAEPWFSHLSGMRPKK